jgi:predicted LPLAT superfamily acyltransferase
MLFLNYYRLGQTLIDKIALGAGMKDNYRFVFENYDAFLDVLNDDKAVIIIGAHTGNWETGAPFFEDYGKKINIVLYDAEYQKIKEALEASTNKFDFKVIAVNQNDFAHIFEIKDALMNKEYVCFQGDRYVNEERLLIADFMGKTAAFPMGPFLIASKLQSPVVFYYAMREKKQTYRFHFTFAEIPENDRTKGATEDLLKEYVRSLEGVLKKYPEQWFNYYDFWKTDNKKYHLAGARDGSVHCLSGRCGAEPRRGGSGRPRSGLKRGGDFPLPNISSQIEENVQNHPVKV